MTTPSFEDEAAFLDLVKRELHNEATEEELAYLQSNKDTLTHWEGALRLLESNTLAIISNHRQILALQEEGQKELWRKGDIQKKNKYLGFIHKRRHEIKLLIHAITLANKEAEKERQAAIKAQKALEKEQVAAERRRNLQIQEEEVTKRLELKMQRHQMATPPSSYATAYRRGFGRGIGYLNALVRQGVPYEQAFALCQEYMQQELTIWRDTWKEGDPPPPFPHIIEEKGTNDETSLPDPDCDL